MDGLNTYTHQEGGMVQISAFIPILPTVSAEKKVPKQPNDKPQEDEILV